MAPKKDNKLLPGDAIHYDQRFNSITEEMTGLRDQWASELGEFRESLIKDIQLMCGHGRDEVDTEGGGTDKLITEIMENRIEPRLTTMDRSYQTKLDNIDRKIRDIGNMVGDLASQLDDQQQYVRRSCLMLHGMEETEGDDAMETALRMLNDKIGANLTSTDMVAVHRIGRVPQSRDAGSRLRPRPIIIKFIRMTQRNQVYSNKKLLKGTGLLITENLTYKRKQFYNELRGRGFQCWTTNGNIHLIDIDSSRRVLRSLTDIENFQSTLGELDKLNYC